MFNVYVDELIDLLLDSGYGCCKMDIFHYYDPSDRNVYPQLTTKFVPYINYCYLH